MSLTVAVVAIFSTVSETVVGAGGFLTECVIAVDKGSIDETGGSSTIPSSTVVLSSLPATGDDTR